MRESARRVVVTGVGILSFESGAAKTWRAVLDGRSGVKALGPDDGISILEELPARVAARVQPGHVVTPDSGHNTKLNWAKTSSFIRYALIAANEALLQADWVPQDKHGRERTGVHIGTGTGCLDEVVEGWRTITRDRGGYRKLSPYFVPNILGNMASGHVSICYGLQGPNHACITACASGAHAIGDSYRLIKYGDADVMVAGGTEASVNALSLAGFVKLRALSTKYNDEPARASRPFDAGRDGFVIGEGSAVLILEELEHARQRGAPHIMAEVLGYGLTGDGHHITSPAPDGDGAYRSMKAAIRYAGLRPQDIDYVNAHATSTPIGDVVEAKALTRLLQEDVEHVGRRGRRPVLVSSTKGSTGHLLGAAGAIEAAFTVLALRDGFVPHTVNLERTDIDIPPELMELVQEKPRPVPDMQYAMTNSFGFGGTNASLVFGRLPLE